MSVSFAAIQYIINFKETWLIFHIFGHNAVEFLENWTHKYNISLFQRHWSQFYWKLKFWWPFDRRLSLLVTHTKSNNERGNIYQCDGKRNKIKRRFINIPPVRKHVSLVFTPTINTQNVQPHFFTFNFSKCFPRTTYNCRLLGT